MPISFGPGLPSVPSMAVQSQDFVEELLNESRDRATEAVAEAQSVIVSLREARLPGELPAPPTIPALSSTFAGTIGVAQNLTPNLGDITVDLPSAFTPDDIVIPDIASTIPDYVPVVTGLNIPEAPTYTPTEMPLPPSVETDFELADAPVADYGDLPDLYALTLPTFTPPVLAAFGYDAPTFAVPPPSDGIDWAEPTYQGRVATELEAALSVLLAGGTGIAPAVELALWERDRGRLDADAAKQIDAANAKWGAAGYTLPPGMLFAATQAVQHENATKIAALSRDIAIKQADLEQTNRQFAIKAGIEFEHLFVQMYLQVTQRSFDVAKLAVESRIQIFNSQIAAYNVDAQIYGQRIEQYKVGLQYALAQIEAYKAQLDAERVKAEVNKELIAAFAAKIQAFQAQVEAYRALVQSATARAELQKNKVDLYRAEIEGRIAQVQAKKMEFEAYAARVQGEVGKGQLEESNARAYTARVNAITAVGELQMKEVDAGIAVSRQKLEYAVANLQRLGEMARVQLSTIQARGTAYEVETRRRSAEFEAKKSVEAMNIQTVIEGGRNIVARYQAEMTAWNARVQQIIEIAKLNSSSMAAAGQIASNLAAGAMAGTSVSAGFQGSVSRGENTSQSEVVTESESTSTSDSNSYATNHNYNHEV